MGVTTTADEKIASARDHIEAAIKDLFEVVVNECWGHDDFKPEYREDLEKTFNKLVKIKKKI